MEMKIKRLAEGLAEIIDLTPEEKRQIDKLDSTERSFESGSTLIEFGSASNFLYVIHSGWAAACRYVETGDRQILDIYMPGQIMCMRQLGCATAASNFECLSDVVASPVSISDISKLLARIPRLADIFVMMMARQDAMLTERLTNVGRRKAPRRLAHLLLELRSRAGIRSLDFKVPMSQEMIADTLGITSVHVSRTFKSLGNRKLLEYDHGTIYILNMKRLLEFADFNPDYLKPRMTWVRLPP